MKKSLLKVVSFLLTVFMAVSVFPFSVFASPSMTIVVSSAKAMAGSNVNVTVSLVDNPGVSSIALNIAYDSSLTLEGIQFNENLGGQTIHSQTLTSPVVLRWVNGTANFTEDAVFATLSFKVKDDAPENTEAYIMASYDPDDIYNLAEQNIDCTIVSGSIRIIDCIPGDINGDEKVNNKDVSRLMQYLALWDVEVNEAVLDVNGDDKINNKDVSRLMQYLALWDVPIYPGAVHPNTCVHTFEAIPAVAATCTEPGNIAYWYCTKCGKFFSDSNGFYEVALEGTVVPAAGHTPEVRASVGYTEGVWCDVCHTWLSGHEPINPEENEYTIAYRMWYVEETTINNTIRIYEDNYLKQQAINNPNGNTYVEGVGIPELETPTVDGYDFLGWYAYPEVNANRIYSISASETGNKTIYAIWSKHVYTITYVQDSADSTLPKIPNETFTIDKETALQSPSWPNLVWIGWSDEEGNVVKSIPKGTARDVTLTANWMSKRNQTIPNTNYASSVPAIVEEDGVIAFAYEIGDIQNVPIQQVIPGAEGVYNLVKGQTTAISKTFTEKIEQSEATNVSNTISNATTNSDSWTLSEDWNESTSFSQEHANEVTEEQMQKATQSYSSTNKYSIGAGIGGTKEHIDENGKSTKVTKYQELGMNYNVGTSMNVGLNAGIGKKDVASVGGDIGLGVEQSFGINYKNGREDVNEKYEKHTDKVSTNWNINEGFETSSTCSASAEFSQKIGQTVKDTYKYGQVLDFGGSNSNTVSSSNTSTDSRQYGSSVTYRTESGNTYTVNETLTADADTGWYRKVLAANFKVFAVVIYDIESGTFSTMTYSVKINDSEHLFTDYSTVSSFDDYENGVLPFSVPFYVMQYVYGVVGASDGLRIDEATGIIESYGYKDPATGILYKKYNANTDTYSEPCDTDVILPRYSVVGSGLNKRIVEVKGFASGVFSGTTVTSIHLNEGITEIPDSAFENCSELKYITGPNIERIGSNAFKNCTSLCEMTLSSQITSLGSGAFDGSDGVTVYASTPEIVKTAMGFNVGRLTIDLNYMEGSLDGEQLETQEGVTYFELNGGGKTFSNLTIESDAETTDISNITINSSISNPVKLSSRYVNLGFTKITAAGFALNLTNDTTTVTLEGNNYIESNSENAMLSKNIILNEKEESSSIGKMRIKGNALVYGEHRGDQFSSFDSAVHNFVTLTQGEYERYFTSLQVSFNSNGGEPESFSRVMYYGESFIDLPVPSRDYYSFDGWYTEPEGGDRIDEGTPVLLTGDITLYAHWTEHELSGWVLASNVPDGANVKETKWTYVYTTGSELGNSSNYNIIDYSTEWSEYGAWSDWSTSEAINSDSRQVETKHVDAVYKNQYHYYRYVNSSHTSYGTRGFSDCYYLERITLDYELTYKATVDGIKFYGTYSGISYFKDRWIKEDGSYSGPSPYITQALVTAAHNEYRYRDRSLIYIYTLESENDPTGQANVSDVQQWVRYIAK